MKKHFTPVNIILLIAVAFLYYLHFNQNMPDSPQKTERNNFNESIVYINVDSVLKNFSDYQIEKEAFSKKNSESEKILNDKLKNYENQVKKYQERAMMMTTAERESAEKRLLSQQQELAKIQQEYIGKATEEETAISLKAYNKIQTIMAELSKEKKYKYVLGYSQGGGILFANDSLDISQEVIKRLNAKP